MSDRPSGEREGLRNPREGEGTGGPVVSRPPERTRRQEILALLGEGPYTARDLARTLGIRLRLVLDDLEHLRRSLNGGRLVVQPAQCLSCGKVFAKRTRLSTPSRCPSCRSEHIREPLLEVR